MPRIGEWHAQMGQRTGEMHIAIAQKRKTMAAVLRLNRFGDNIIGFHHGLSSSHGNNLAARQLSRRGKFLFQGSKELAHQMFGNTH